MKATVAEIKEWLDIQVAVYHLEHKRLVLTEKKDIFSDDENKMVPDIKLGNISASDHVHINDESLRLVAEAMKLPIEVVDRGDEDKNYRYQLSFMYNEVRFLSIESEDEYNERGELV